MRRGKRRGGIKDAIWGKEEGDEDTAVQNEGLIPPLLHLSLSSPLQLTGRRQSPVSQNERRPGRSIQEEEKLNACHLCPFPQINSFKTMFFHRHEDVR